MAKRGYKLQEFIAHSGNVNCLSLAKKRRRGLFITGGDDQVVNLWSIGKPAPLVSLSGHTSPVESVAFDPGEAFVVAGASAGAIKLWDMEQAKMVSNFGGHRSYCTAVEYHQSGDFFASGSKDTNIKIWDIRKKERIHMYKGHARGISTLRFTPDGRWLVSGGLDNVVKIWDLTAGKLLHDLKFHQGHIRSIDFHPMELLMATGSADKTVKFWDLETFELIGSSKTESAGVRSIAFHPEGKTLCSGLDDCLKVYSWEPVVCHDTIDMGWSTLRDICIQDGKLLGGSYYQNLVGIWMTETLFVEPYKRSSVAEPNSKCEQVHDKFQDISLKKAGSFRRSTSSSTLQCISPDDEDKDIKNIYVDTAGENPVPARKDRSIKSSKIVSLSNTNEINDCRTQGEVPAVYSHVKPVGQTTANSFVLPTVVPQDSSDEKEGSRSWRESLTSTKAALCMPDKTSHVSRATNTTLDVKSPPVVALSFNDMKSSIESTKDLKTHCRVVADYDSKEPSQEKPQTRIVAENSEKQLSSRTLSDHKKCNELLTGSKGVKPVRYVNGVAVVHGRTRSLVERFERKENLSMETQVHDPAPQGLSETSQAPMVVVDTPLKLIPDASKGSIPVVDSTPQVLPDTAKLSTIVADSPLRMVHDTAKEPTILVDVPSRITPNTKTSTSTVDLPPKLISNRARASSIMADSPPRVTPESAKLSTIVADSPPRRNDTAKESTIVVDLPSRITPDTKASNTIVDLPPKLIPNRARASTILADSPPRAIPDTAKASTTAVNSPPLRPNRARASTIGVDAPPRVSNTTRLSTSVKRSSRPTSAPRLVTETLDASSMNSRPQLIRREPMFHSDDNVPEDLMKNHDVFLSNLRSRLTKLQVVRHFLERNDIKGAINAMQKLPDHSVQAELISLLAEKMDILTLDLFLCLLPVLFGLLDSKAERHVNIALEMLLKLVAVFGPVIRSTISAPPAIGVNLQAERRLECCSKCSILLQQIQKALPAVARRGGILEKSAQELTLVLQDS